MTKKNRFNMLEGIGNEEPKKEEASVPVDKSRAKDVKVVVAKEDFEQNLKKHKLTEKITEIERQKVDIGFQINKAKARSMIWFALGIFFIVMAFNRFGKKTLTRTVVGETEGTYYFDHTVMSRTNYIIIGVLALGFYLFNRKGKK